MTMSMPDRLLWDENRPGDVPVLTSGDLVFTDGKAVSRARGSADSAVSLTSAGFTALGYGNTAVKVKKITGVTGSSAASMTQTTVNGIDNTKIVGINMLINSTVGSSTAIAANGSTTRLIGNTGMALGGFGYTAFVTGSKLKFATLGTGSNKNRTFVATVTYIA